VLVLKGAYRVLLVVIASLSVLSCNGPDSDRIPPSSDGGLLITSATVIDGTGGPQQANMSVLLRDGEIVTGAPDGEIDAPDRIQIIDASGKFVIPGLSDVHFHFGLGAPIPSQPDDKEESLARELYYGVTTILQIGATAGCGGRFSRLFRLVPRHGCRLWGRIDWAAPLRSLTVLGCPRRASGDWT